MIGIQAKEGPLSFSEVVLSIGRRYLPSNLKFFGRDTLPSSSS